METHDTYERTQGSYRSYIIGFILSIVLTLLAYFLVVGHHFTGFTLVLILIGLSVLQVLVQLRFFLHLGEESKPYWNILTFLFTVLVIGILVLGTLWIMYELNYRMMPAMSIIGLN